MKKIVSFFMLSLVTITINGQQSSKRTIETNSKKILANKSDGISIGKYYLSSKEISINTSTDTIKVLENKQLILTSDTIEKLINDNKKKGFIYILSNL